MIGLRSNKKWLRQICSKDHQMKWSKTPQVSQDYLKLLKRLFLTISSSPCWLEEGSGQQVNSGTRGAKTPYGVVYHTLGLQPHASIRPGLHCSWKLWATLFTSLTYAINTRQCPEHCFDSAIRPLKKCLFFAYSNILLVSLKSIVGH